MLQKIKIRNFQIHRKLLVDLDPTLNTFVGPTDRGKSSVLRAIRFACLNRPSGEAFVKHGAETASVELTVSGRRVRRCRGKGTNEYRLDDRKFAAFGSEVPRQIAELVNVDAVNFQTQHSGPYWFDKSHGEVSKELNGIVNLGLIDSTLGNLAKELRKAKATVEVSKERLRFVKEERHRLAWAKEADAELKELEEGERKSQARKERAGRLVALIEEVKRSKEMASVEIPDLGELEKLSEAVLDRKIVREALEDLLGQAKQAESEKEIAEAEWRKVSKELKRKVGKNCPLCGGPKSFRFTPPTST